MSPKTSTEKRFRESTPPTQKTDISPENKAFRPNETSESSMDDKKRKARGKDKKQDSTDNEVEGNPRETKTVSPKREDRRRVTARRKLKKKDKSITEEGTQEQLKGDIQTTEDDIKRPTETQGTTRGKETSNQADKKREQDK